MTLGDSRLQQMIFIRGNENIIKFCIFAANFELWK